MVLEVFPPSLSAGTVNYGVPLLPCVPTPLTLEARLDAPSSGELPSAGPAVAMRPGGWA